MQARQRSGEGISRDRFGQICERGRERQHLLHGQSKFETVQWVADSQLTLYILVGQGCQNSSRFDICSACSHIPGWHSNPALETDQNEEKIRGRLSSFRYIWTALYTRLKLCTCTHLPINVSRRKRTEIKT